MSRFINPTFEEGVGVGGNWTLGVFTSAGPFNHLVDQHQLAFDLRGQFLLLRLSRQCQLRFATTSQPVEVL